MQIWNGSPDGSTPVLVFETTPDARIWIAGGPVCSPDRAQIAFRYSTSESDRVYLVANADGTGQTSEIDHLQYPIWRGGWYFCDCYG